MPAVASRGRGRRSVNEINMVPFIDVMLVLLIIFMVTATVITPGAINVPTAGKSSRPPENYMIVAIDDKGVYSHNTGRPAASVCNRREPCPNNGLQPACIRFQALGCNQGVLLSNRRISSRLCGNPFAARARAKQAPAGVGGAESTAPI